MRFHFEQTFQAPAGDVAEAYADRDFYAALAALPKLGTPEVVSHERDGDRVRLEVRYRFTGHLSSAARAVIDPARLTWVERCEHDLASRTATYRMIADHYADRFAAGGRYRFVPHGAGGAVCRRVTDGELTIRVPFVGGKVEAAIVSGIGEHLEAEVPIVEQFIRRAAG